MELSGPCLGGAIAESNSTVVINLALEFVSKSKSCCSLECCSADTGPYSGSATWVSCLRISRHSSESKKKKQNIANGMWVQANKLSSRSFCFNSSLPS